MPDKRLFHFDPYQLDVQERQLLRGAQVIPLPPKLFDLLTVLVRHGGHLLDKQALLDEVWTDVAVEEGSLTRGISALRQALGSAPDGKAYIETVAKRGYRFRADVRQTGAATAVSPPAHGVPAPPSLLHQPQVSFVGRDTEISQLQEVWQHAVSGQRQLLLIAGEAGIGKTRLSLEFARRRVDEGTTVLLGYSDQEVLVPYQPFVEALGWYVRVCSDGELRALLAATGGGAELGALIPQLTHRVPDLPTAPAMNPQGQRYRLFEAVSAALAAVSSASPLLLVFDDLHWADNATLQLLQHVVRSPRPASMAVIATYRESELGRAHPLGEMVMKLRHEPGVTRLTLRGLDDASVGRLVDAIVGPDAPSHLASLVVRSTEGNPFFASEMLRHLKECGALALLDDETRRDVDLTAFGLSEGIKEVIGRRLSRLGEACNRMLALGAVIGPEFEVAVLEAVADLPEDDLVDALEDATRAQVIRESPGAPGRFSFMHALIRDTLYDGLSSPRRVRLHKRVADALERFSQDGRRPPLADLAHHFAQAVSLGTLDKAIDYASRAGDQAAEALAHEDAARFYEMALRLLDLGAGDEAARNLRIDLHMRRAHAFESMGQFQRAIDELNAALGELDAQAIERRCEIMLRLARAWFILLDLRPVERYASEVLQLAGQIDRPDFAASAIAWRARCEQAVGDLARAIETDREAMTRGPSIPVVTHMFGPLTLYLAGRLPEAVALANQAADAARSSRDTPYVMYSLSHLGMSLTACGKYAEAAEVFHEVRSFGRKYGAIPLLARATAIAGGLHLALFDYEGADALQAEACDLARSAAFPPPMVSASIDFLLASARQHEPGRAEWRFDETVAASASTAGWHQWLWDLRLMQARAELACARREFELALNSASAAIVESRKRARPKYEALGLMTRAQALQAFARTPEAIADARQAIVVARSMPDPVLLLQALDALIGLDGDDALLAEAHRLIVSIRDAVPDPSIRQRFMDSEVVRRLRPRD